MREEAGEYLRHAAEQALLVLGQRVPGSDDVEGRPWLVVDARLLGVGIQRREPSRRGKDPALLLSFEHELAVGLVAHVELALVLLDPLLRCVVGRMTGARAE